MKSVLTGLILASLALAQYPKAGGYAPLTGARNIQTGTTGSPPKTTGCVPGDIYFATDATPGQQLYLNSATGVCVWVQQLDTTGSTGGPLTYQGGSAITIVSGTIYCPPYGSGQCSATEADVQLPSAIQGTITSIYANLSLAPGAAKSAAITWRKTGADQSSTCTISGATTPATCNDNSHSFAVSQGDLLDYKVVWTGSILVNPTLSVISALGQGASSGSVNTGTAGQCGYYAAGGTAISGCSMVLGVPVYGTPVRRQLAPVTVAGDYDIFTCPASTRCLVGLLQQTRTDAVGTGNSFYPEIKISGTYYPLATNSALSFNASATVGIVLAAGQIFSVNVNSLPAATSVNYIASDLEYPSSAGPFTAYLAGMATGDNTLYIATGPAVAYASGTAPYALSSGIQLVGDSGGPRTITTYLVPSGQSSGSAYTIQNAFTLSASTRVNGLLSSALNTGDFLVVNVSTGAATQFAWVNLILPPQ